MEVLRVVEIKLPCEIGIRIKDKNDNFEGRITGYKIIGNGNPFSPSHKAMAEVIDIHDEDNEVFIVSYNGIFPDNIEIIGY